VERKFIDACRCFSMSPEEFNIPEHLTYLSSAITQSGVAFYGIHCFLPGFRNEVGILPPSDFSAEEAQEFLASKCRPRDIMAEVTRMCPCPRTAGTMEGLRSSQHLLRSTHRLF